VPSACEADRRCARYGTAAADPARYRRIEIARNAFTYAGGGRAEFFLEGATAPQLLSVSIVDEGKGIAHLDDVLDGRYRSETGMGLGIAGARRLMDRFHIETSRDKGTSVVFGKLLPRTRR